MYICKKIRKTISATLSTMMILGNSMNTVAAPSEIENRAGGGNSS